MNKSFFNETEILGISYYSIRYYRVYFEIKNIYILLTLLNIRKLLERE